MYDKCYPFFYLFPLPFSTDTHFYQFQNLAFNALFYFSSKYITSLLTNFAPPQCNEHAFLSYGLYFFQFYGEYAERSYSEQEFTSLRFEELEEAYFLTSSLEEKMPFLQMLQSVESQPFKEPNFQNLLKLQHLNKPAWEEEVSQIQELVELYSSPVNSETKDQNQHPNSASCTEGVSSECNQMAKAPPVTKERRKRKRSRPTKNKEEVESQRMTHIAVERNRRRQMNDHLNVIKSLIPTSYIQRVLITIMKYRILIFDVFLKEHIVFSCTNEKFQIFFFCAREG